MGGPAIIDGVEHSECDNFELSNFTINGVTYPTAEHYMQCQKATNDSDFHKILKSDTGLGAWVYGNKIKLRKDWEAIKVKAMYEGNLEKFKQNEDLRNALLSSKGKVEFNNSTPFWNHWNALIMERIRAELRANEDDLKVAEEIKGIMDQYESDQRLKRKI